MKFTKLPTSIDQQILLLQSRGMTIYDSEDAMKWLENVGYYRLSAYWLPFEIEPKEGQVRSKLFADGTNFEEIKKLYIFDRKLRLLFIEATERIEIHLRSRWTYYMCHEFGPHCHLEHEHFVASITHPQLLNRLTQSIDGSKEVFIEHYRSKYEPFSPPLWSATELLTFGDLSKWFQITRNNKIKNKIAKEFGLPTVETAQSIFQVLCYIRNICAHHSRLWNRRLVKRPMIVKQWKNELQVLENQNDQSLDNKIYNMIVILTKLIEFRNPESTLKTRFRILVDELAHSHQTAMGFPENWRKQEFWCLPRPS